MTDLYSLLGVARTATTDEIRKAYLRLARERHPDRFQDPVEKERAQEFFKEITEAFNTLGNESARREYDAAARKPQATTPEALAEQAFAESQSLLESGALGEAVDKLRAALYHRPSEVRYQRALGHALLRHPKTAREGVQALEQAAQLAPSDAGIQIEIAEALIAQGLPLRARRYAQNALHLAPSDATAQRLVAETTPSQPGHPEGPEGGGFLSRLRGR